MTSLQIPSDSLRVGTKLTIGRSQNALRHGLNTIHRFSPHHRQAILDFAAELCGADEHPLLHEEALIIAECEFILRAADAMQQTIIAHATAAPLAHSGPKPTLSGDDVLKPVPNRHNELSQELRKLERYRRRANSRRKKALARFVRIKADLADIRSMERTNQVAGHSQKGRLPPDVNDFLAP